ncbi:hypothetical protein I3842_04G148300 [Carya illinoinensis]|uniref:Uncharacterized protein n=1 Tax=Carya illinoinensis TaxID=32201 RepID=A0A922FAJ3_CARIL|nr:hypothetical protein I3842_04G148300 [Carya illinoinensis]KAG6718424.1 hypothetical protein I3842_04G148300 [Carya illinoinensis]
MEETASGKLIRQNSSASTGSDYHPVKDMHLAESQMELATPSELLLSIEEESPMPNRCIYKVPYHLRNLNRKSYTPQVISIGPLHHGNKNFQTMEKYKVKYLNAFASRVNMSIESLLVIVRNNKERIGQCYAETIELDSDEFVKMILLDATFIIEYFLRDMFPVQWTDEDRTVMKPWIIARMQLDFLLLENQLPFFILEELYQLVLVTNTIFYCPFIKVVFRYFHFLNTQLKSSDSHQFNGILHFVDLMRSFYLPPISLIERESFRSYLYEEMYCASQLAEAGLIFKKSKSPCQLDLKFQDGVLEIPGFTLDKDTQTKMWVYFVERRSSLIGWVKTVQLLSTICAQIITSQINPRSTTNSVGNHFVSIITLGILGRLN